jgi:DNA-binding winged helix-turn-helix (wHTH) protein
MSLHPDARRLARSVLRLGELRIEVGTLSVLGRGEAGRLTPKSLGLLLELARHPQQTVTRDELLDRLWPDSEPTADAVSHAVRELRRALGDDARAPRLIETVRGVGYRLCVLPAVETPPGPTAWAPPQPAAQARSLLQPGPPSDMPPLLPGWARNGRWALVLALLLALLGAAMR